VAESARPRSALGRIAGSPYLLWAILALPAAHTLFAYWRGTTFYGEVVHSSGLLAVRLLIVAMAVTPLSLAFPRAGWTRWLRAHRRHFGVAAFAYSLLHTAVYVQRQAWTAIFEDALTIAMWTGWFAFVVMLALAVTSNDASVRWLRGRWKWLHRAVYAAAILTFAHWILSAFDPIPGWIHLGVLAALEAYRIWWMRRRAFVPTRD
jgi:sulfoxide reductase heme-binding subunit YedZ